MSFTIFHNEIIGISNETYCKYRPSKNRQPITPRQYACSGSLSDLQIMEIKPSSFSTAPLYIPARFITASAGHRYWQEHRSSNMKGLQEVSKTWRPFRCTGGRRLPREAASPRPAEREVAGRNPALSAKARVESVTLREGPYPECRRRFAWPPAYSGSSFPLLCTPDVPDSRRRWRWSARRARRARNCRP